MKKILLYLLIFNYCSLIEAQSIILKNPSFEGTPAASRTPEGWRDCGKPGETPPDTQPNATYRFEKEAYDGKTYIGMVTRSTDTWEAIGQELHKPMEADSCYDFSLYLARSKSYSSMTRTAPPRRVSFIDPIRLRIWAGNNYCDKRELLEETSTVEHTDWRPYKFKLKPHRNYDFITLEAFYMTPTLVAYNGNILVDNCSHIVFASCESEEYSDYLSYVSTKEDSILLLKEMEMFSKKDSILLLKEKEMFLKEDDILRPKEMEVKTPRTMWELDKEAIRKGQIIRIYYLFEDDIEFKETLDEVYDFLSQVPNFSIEIGGHASKIRRKDINYDSLSLIRAEAIAEYLINKGIDASKIVTIGYGIKENIAGNMTKRRREANQRIEIKFIGSKNDD